MSNVLAVTLANVESSYEGIISSGRRAWVEGKIDEAVRELVNLIPSIPARVAAGTLDHEYVTDKIVGSVLRVVRNPEGLESEQEGDYSYKLRNIMASGDIWYTDKDLYQLGYVDPKKNGVPRTVYTQPSRGFGFPL